MKKKPGPSPAVVLVELAATPTGTLYYEILAAWWLANTIGTAMKPSVFSTIGN